MSVRSLLGLVILTPLLNYAEHEEPLYTQEGAGCVFCRTNDAPSI
jgi:hypothetical protein